MNRIERERLGEHKNVFKRKPEDRLERQIELFVREYRDVMTDYLQFSYYANNVLFGQLNTSGTR